MAKKPILVAGRSGQLARCLQDWAVRRNLPMAALGRPDLDLEHLASIERAVTAIEPCVIINTAAYTAVDRAETEPARAYAINRDGAEHLAAAARKKGNSRSFTSRPTSCSMVASLRTIMKKTSRRR